LWILDLGLTEKAAVFTSSDRVLFPSPLTATWLPYSFQSKLHRMIAARNKGDRNADRKIAVDSEEFGQAPYNLKIRNPKSKIVMGAASKYWTLIGTDPNRGKKSSEIAAAKAFFCDRFGSSELSDSEIEGQLLEQFRGEMVARSLRSPTPAELCLRCLISGAIEQVCLQLEFQFGTAHGFTRYDLFGFVLNDVDLNSSLSTQILGDESLYKPLAAEILRSFDPTRSRLSTWTNRLVKQERSLCAFLLERGVYLVGDWAILNDTQPKQLPRILGDFLQLAGDEIEQNQILLASYHAVYRRDRLNAPTGKCSLPTSDQLQRMSDRIFLKTRQKLALPDVLERLQTLANFLRQYRLHRRNRTLPTQSLDDPNLNPRERVPVAPSDRADETQQEFLQLYRQHLLRCLDLALADAIGDRIAYLQTQKSNKVQQFVAALRLLHCQGQAMDAIAPQIGLKAQYQVSRLLTLRQLRAAVKQRLLERLLNCTLETAIDYAAPECLSILQERLEIALNEEIDEMLAEAQIEAELKNKESPLKSLFARRLCHFLDLGF
jgi:hypothetical protein